MYFPGLSFIYCLPQLFCKKANYIWGRHLPSIRTFFFFAVDLGSFGALPNISSKIYFLDVACCREFARSTCSATIQYFSIQVGQTCSTRCLLNNVAMRCVQLLRGCMCLDTATRYNVAIYVLVVHLYGHAFGIYLTFSKAGILGY